MTPKQSAKRFIPFVLEDTVFRAVFRAHLARKKPREQRCYTADTTLSDPTQTRGALLRASLSVLRFLRPTCIPESSLVKSGISKYKGYICLALIGLPLVSTAQQAIQPTALQATPSAPLETTQQAPQTSPISPATLSLWDAYQRLREGEPGLLGAAASLQAAQQKSLQARAGLGPQLNLNASSTANDRDYSTRDGITRQATDRYNGNARQVTLAQPLWRNANRISRDQALAGVAQAERQLDAAGQGGTLQLVQVWFEVMQSRDNRVAAYHQAQAAAERHRLLAKAYELGGEARPALEEAKARWQQALADETAAQTDMFSKLAQLEQLIGPVNDFSPGSPSPAGFVPPVLHMAATLPASLAELLGGSDSARSVMPWLEQTEQRNPQVAAAREAVKVAEHEVNKQRAGHEPTLDLNGSYGYNSQSVGNFPGQSGFDIKQGTLGVQLNLPLYASGAQSAKVAEARAMLDKARQELEAARRNALSTVKQAWYAMMAARHKATAAQSGVDAALAALDMAEQGKQSGLKLELDRLQAQQLLHSARRDWFKAQYDAIAAACRLKATAGGLNDDDIRQLSAALVPDHQSVNVVRSPSSIDSSDPSTTAQYGDEKLGAYLGESSP